MNVSAESRIVSAISFGVFWRLRAFDQRDHPVEKAAAFLHRDPNHNAIADHARAAGDGAAVAAAFANHRSRFTRDGGLVHAGDAFDHFAIGRNHIARFADDEVAFLQIRRGHFFLAPIAQAARHRFFARLAQTVRLRFAAAFGHGFGKISEQHREPEPDRQLRDEAAQSLEVKIPTVVSTAPTMVTNMTGFLTIRRGSSFYERRRRWPGRTMFQSNK